MTRLALVLSLGLLGCEEELIEHEPDAAHADSGSDAGRDGGLDGGCRSSFDCPCGQECGPTDGGGHGCRGPAPHHCATTPDCAAAGHGYQCLDRGCGQLECLIP